MTPEEEWHKQIGCYCEPIKGPPCRKCDEPTSYYDTTRSRVWFKCEDCSTEDRYATELRCRDCGVHIRVWPHRCA